MSNSINFSLFLEQKIAFTIAHSELIGSVSIFFSHQDVFGNENVVVHYQVDAKANREDELRSQLRKLYTKEVDQPHYVFTLNTEKTRFTDGNFLTWIEFSNIYSSLTNYAILQLERRLGSEFPIKVKSLDQWSQLNYTENFLKVLCNNYRQLQYDIFDNFELNSFHHHNELIQLSVLSKSIIKGNRSRYKLSDKMLLKQVRYMFRLSPLNYSDIRRLILKYQIPIKLKEERVINEVFFAPSDFLTILKDELDLIKSEKHNWSTSDGNLYRDLIDLLYEIYLAPELETLIDFQGNRYIEEFVVKTNDILLLKNGRFVVADSHSLLNEIQGFNIYTKYYILKKNLDKGERTKTIHLDEVEGYVEGTVFQEYKSGIPKHLQRWSSSTEKWLLKKIKKVSYNPFRPDLYERIPNEKHFSPKQR